MRNICILVLCLAVFSAPAAFADDKRFQYSDLVVGANYPANYECWGKGVAKNWLTGQMFMQACCTGLKAGSCPALTDTINKRGDVCTNQDGTIKNSAGCAAPPTVGTYMLKGNGAGGFAQAVAGTDYLAGIASTTSLLKGDGAGGTTSYGGTTCTNKTVSALSAAGSATCVTLTSAYVDTSIATTGVDINTSGQVTATHLASPLSVAQGGTASADFGYNGTAHNKTLSLSGSFVPGNFGTLDISGNFVDSGCSSCGGGGGGGGGTVTSVGMTVPSFLSVAGSPIVNSGTLAVTADSQSGRKVLASPSDGSSGTPAFRALVEADLPTLTQLSAYMKLDGSTNMAGNLLPNATDTYTLGDSTHLWKKGWLSEMDAVLFAKNTISPIGGWLMVAKDTNTFPSNVSAGDTTIDFGSAMTPNDFVIMRAAGQVEYIQVGSLVSGTTYNVTRDKDGTGANNWSAGTPWVNLGYNGTGRIEIDAYDNRISGFTQGTSYNVQTEKYRLGDLTGITYNGSPLSGYGLWTNNGYFTGSVISTSGTIGGWTLGSTSLKSGSGGTTVGLDSGGTNPAIYAGSDTPGDAPFQVANDGSLIASNADISGTFKSLDGSQSGLTIGKDIADVVDQAVHVYYNGTETAHIGGAFESSYAYSTLWAIDHGGGSLGHAAFFEGTSTAGYSTMTSDHSSGGLAATFSQTTLSGQNHPIVLVSRSGDPIDSNPAQPSLLIQDSTGADPFQITGQGLFRVNTYGQLLFGVPSTVIDPSTLGASLTKPYLDETNNHLAFATMYSDGATTDTFFVPRTTKLSYSGTGIDSTSFTDLTEMSSGTIPVNGTVSFNCQISWKGTSTSRPRFQFTGPASPGIVTITYDVYTSTAANTINQVNAFSSPSAACTSSCLTTNSIARIYGYVVAGATPGVVQMQVASSTAGQSVTIWRGSICTWY